MKARGLQSQKYLLSRKKALLGAAFFVLLLAFVPFYTAQAWGVLDWASDAISNLIIMVLTSIPALIFFTVAGLANWIIGIVLAIGIIPGAENTPDFVKTGWEISRSIVNALFILILVFIGLTTILRLQTYQLQKTLPSLIIIALLVNFSGVLVGFVVDISNIVTRIFLDAAGSTSSQSFIGIFNNGKDVVDSLNNIAQALAYGFVLAIFYIIAALIFFVLFLLFFVRTIILWLLTILAPLAFGAYILPGTKKYFDQWRQQLVQWSIIGIPIGFFLWLSNTILNGGDKIFGEFSGLSGEVGFLSGLVGSILSPIVGIAVLFFGITLSMQLAPAAAQGVIDRGKKWGKEAGAFGGRAAWKFRGVGKWKIDKGIGEKVQGFGERLRKRGEGLPLIQTKLAEKEKELSDFTAPGRAALTAKEQAKANKLDREITDLKKQEEKAKEPRTGAENVGYYTGGFLTRWAGRAIERGGGAIGAQVAKKDVAAFAQAQTDASSRKAESNLDVLATELVKPEIMRDKAKIAGIIAGMRARNDWDEIEDAVEKKLMFKWEQIGKNVLVDAFSTLGSYGLRPMTLGNAGRYIANPREHGFNADPIFDPENPGRVTGFTGSDAKWLTDHVLNDVPRRWEAAALKTNSTPPRGSYQPFDIKTDAGGTVSFAPNAQSSQAFEYAALFSGRTDVWQAILGLREGGRAQAAANLWRNVDPLNLGKEGVARFIKWVSASQDARNLGVQTAINPEELAKLVTAIETGQFTEANKAAAAGDTPGIIELREIRARYMNEGRDSLKKFLQSSHSPDETDQILKLLGREGLPPATPPPPPPTTPSPAPGPATPGPAGGGPAGI